MLGSTSRWVVTAAATAALVAMAGGPATAQGPAVRFPKIKEKVAKFTIDVAGYVTTEQLTDTTSDCYPGRSYHQVNSISFESGSPAKLEVHSVSAPGLADPVITSKSSKSLGRADMTSRVFGWRTTNYCAPTEPDPEPIAPTCSASRGKIRLSLTPGRIPEETDGLHPLNGIDMLLMIMRTGGGSDSPSCPGESASRVSGPSGDRTVLSAHSMPGQSQIVPSGFDGPQLFGLKRKTKRAIVISGPCSNVTTKVYKGTGPSPSQGSVNADGDCWMHGKVVLTLAPRK